MANSIKYIFGADATAFHAATKGMEKGTQAVQKNIVGSFQKIGGAIAAAFSVQQVGSFVKSVAGFAKEIASLADMAGVSAERLQRMSAATRSVNVSQEKLADILKDVNDKFGDFVQNRSGPMKDFFDNIAPKVGLTANEFKNLTSDQILIKYVKALQDANLSQAEMTFYMEAIGNDATRLIPLLRENAKELENLAAAAQVLTDEDTKALQRANDAFAELDRTLKVLVGGSLADWIETAESGLVPTLKKISTDTDNLRIVLGALQKGFGFATKEAREFFKETFPDSTVDLDKPVEDLAEAVSGVDKAFVGAKENVIIMGDKIVELPNRTAKPFAAVEAQIAAVDKALNDFFGELDKSNRGFTKINGEIVDQDDYIEINGKRVPINKDSRGGNVLSKKELSKGQKLAMAAVKAYQDQLKAINEARDAANEKLKIDRESVDHINDQAGAMREVADETERAETALGRMMQNRQKDGYNGTGGFWATKVLPNDLTGLSDQAMINFARRLSEQETTVRTASSKYRGMARFGGEKIYESMQRMVTEQWKQLMDELNTRIALSGGTGRVMSRNPDRLLREYAQATQTQNRMLTRQEQLLATIANNTKRGS